MRYESDYYAYNPYNPATTLQQHGILGMKWGRWNEETRARYLGLNKQKNKSNLSEAEKKKIDKKYFKESSYKIKRREQDKDGRYTDKWVTSTYKTHVLDAKKIIKDLDDDFYNKIDEAKNDYKKYEARHLTEKSLVQDLDDYWYGGDFSLNMFPVFGTDAEYKKELKDYWAKGLDDSAIDRIYYYMVEKTKYAERIESICEDEAKALGISDSMIDTAKDNLYSFFVNPTKLSKDIARQLSHSNSSDSRYFATDSYDPQTTANHHGIMGMKWGVWNAETRARYMGSGSKTKWFSKITDRFNKPKEEPHLKRTHLSKELADISDAELNAAIKRMQLEQTYLQMLKNYPDASDRGRKYADQFADNLFNQLTTGLGGSMGKRLSKAIDDWINDDGDSGKRKSIEAEARKKTLKQLNEDNAYEKAVKTYTDNKINKK